MLLSDNVRNIKGIGEKTVKLLEKLDVYTVSDLLFHFPRDYDDFAMPMPAKSAEEGKVITVEGSISRITARSGRRSVVSCYVSDATGALKLVWFNQPFIAKMLKPGYRFLIRGTVKRDNAEMAVYQPKIYNRNDYVKLMDSLQPIYDLTKGITSAFISKSVKQALQEVEIEDKLPLKFRKENDLMKLSEAIRTIHFPKNKQEALYARRRLVFDEFVEFLTSLRQLQVNKAEEINRYVIKECTECEKLISELPFELTGDQKKTFSDIKKDMSSAQLMSRMIEGDVGSGKTVLAMLSALAVVKSGYQAALMVPTEVLARQHYEEFSERLSKYGVNTELLVGSQTAAQKKKIYSLVKNGEADIIIGTHALIQEGVEFNNLALVIIDEQHRFGVKQRRTLKEKGLKPHILSMSATPIPRSLSLILYGDMDLSVIKEMPKERLPIKNCVVDTGFRQKAFDLIRKEVSCGHQAYIICPMVEGSEEVDGENVTDYTETLREYYQYAGTVLNDGLKVKVDYLHGKMKPQEKNDIMERFAKGEINVLVSTTVIEVGVNVKNATVMMIENSEKFGIAQLHQLRGRVGRGSFQSYCIFMKGCAGKDIDERLDILKNNNDGFKVAEEDLRLRGPGDLFGVRQSGEQSWKLADIYADADLLALASEYVK